MQRVKNKKISVMLALIFCALLAQAQDVPPDAPWESDPLDVLEPQQREVVEPTVPEFKEIPEPGQEEIAPPAPEVAEPSMPTELPPEATPTEVASPALGGSTEPDYSREAEFHRIYKTYNEQPTSEEVWEKAVGGRESEVYAVQKGDTLSGISQTFFGDPLFWPKVWSFNNGQILNPHEIDPGMNIQFFPGSMDDAPTVQVAEAPAAGAEEAVTPGAPKVIEGAPAQIPRPKKRAPLLKNLPGSLPLYRMGAVNTPPVQVEIALPKTQFPTAMENLEYYIQDAPIAGVGKVTGVEMNMQTAGDYQYIYVTLDGAAGGKNYVAQRNVSAVKDPQVKDRVGHMVEIQGEIEVLERVNDHKNVYRAIVKKTIQPVTVGSVLTEGKMPMIDPSVGPVTSGVGAKIMGGQFDTKRTLFGSNSLVFLDGGASQGLQEGQTLNIFADERVRNKNTEAVINDRVIGLIKVVRVAPNFATGYVIKSTDDILLGDYVGKSVVHALNEAAPAIERQSEAPANDDFEKEFEEDTSTEAPAPAPESGGDDSDLDF
ncbi:LysM peptidoglycan-binding domain-containing protein [Bdellovibrio sp. 22V]|uniref:LysM peptidoglycan-binding domain-containing protein n=1 Tax=Bdellovibrio sp. 22V TaxID=3044166 RepID=UPI00254293A2|nr:LysM peptidoglycan-binding domain-containing protein [Bdellovibrio sp. 22V]WII73753.1 LysM peptidoglycan-binding domain-containing protein [Bdellovibrio sp. 22V]